MNTRDLLFAADEAENLHFVPRDLFEEILSIRVRLADCRTWGEARALLSPERFGELMNDYVAPADQPPSDDEPLDTGQDQRWPTLSYSQIVGWLPPHVVEEFGEAYSGLMDSGANMPAPSEEEIIEALGEAGISCAEDDRVLELFDVWD